MTATSTDDDQTLPEWMSTAATSILSRADASARRPMFDGDITAEKIREVYRQTTAKAMEKWVLARDDRLEEFDPKSAAPDKAKLFANMYPILSRWMQKRGLSCKKGNVTAHGLAMKALSTKVKVFKQCAFNNVLSTCSLFLHSL